MNRHNFETGIQRAYYAVWALVSCGFTVFILDEAFLYRRHSFDIATFELRERPLGEFVMYAAAASAWIIGPWVLMVVVRWIYRGFLPK